MAFNFPDSPIDGQLFTPPGGPTYVFRPPVWMQLSGAPVTIPSVNNAYNRMVNGAFQHSQELGNSGTGLTGAYFCDQWTLGFAGPSVGAYRNPGGILSPSGNPFRGVLNIITGKPVFAAGDYCFISQAVEGSRVADLAWGTAIAKQAILRFTCRFPIAGTFSVAITNAASTRSWIGIFTIGAGEVGVDVVRTLVIPGDVTGAWVTDNTPAMYIIFAAYVGTNFQGVAGWQAGYKLGAASATNAAAATSTVQITDVGLYADLENTGSPPPWDPPDPAAELLTCQRYWQQIITGNSQTVGPGYNINATQAPVVVPYAVPMRISPPTLVLSSASHFSVSDGGSTVPSAITITGSDNGPRNALILPTCAGLTTGRGNRLVSTSALARMALSARM